MMDMREYYLREVYPRLELPLAAKYPLVTLVDRAGYHSLSEHPLLMLVALTGTGKSTALDIVRARTDGRGAGIIPTRREVADWIAIPLAQAVADEALVPVPDRVDRFALTRRFAQRVPGGMAEAFSWLQIADDYEGLLLSEGIRGKNEIGYALRQFPRWQIVELSLHPLTRLRRLSGRQQDFDQAGETADLSFLPRDLQAEAKSLLAAGKISAKALTIVRAEAANYGFTPFADGAAYQQYQRIDVDDFKPEDVAEALIEVMNRQGAG